jgi:cytoskeleton protein RodZ
VVTLDSEQLEQLKAIGTFLGEVREEEGRTLEDIATKTYIPLRLLKAIEAGQDQFLPEPVFVQGFIRRYGDALGLDGNELSKRFPVKAASVTSAFTVNQEARAGLPNVEPIAYTPLTNVWQPAELPQSRPPYLLIGGAALAALAGLVFGVILPNLKPSPPTAQVPEAPAAIQPSAVQPPAVQPPAVQPPTLPAEPVPSIATSPDASPVAASPKPASPKPAAASKNPVAIDIKLTDESWVEVVVDGVVKYEGTLEKGTNRSWSGKESVRISSGNAGAVLVAFNKGTAKPMGSLGAVEEQTYTPKGAQ